MDSQYTLSTGKIFKIDDYYPKLLEGEKVAIMFTGGVESTLVALIARELYGKDNVVLLHIGLKEYSNYRNNSNKVERIKRDFYRAANNLQMNTYELIGNFESGDHYFNQIMTKLHSDIPGLNYMFAGYNNIHKENIQLLLDCDWALGKLTINDVDEYFQNNKDKYPELDLFVNQLKGALYFVNEYGGFENVIHHFNNVLRPLLDYTKPEIVEMYHLMNLEDYLADTMSCNIVGYENHCGVCKNCLHRKWSFHESGVDDKTQYNS